VKSVGIGLRHPDGRWYLASRMRIAVAVVVGIVLLSSGHAVRANEAPRHRNENCLDSCDFAFEKCQAREGAKGTGRCHTSVVRCKNECPYEAAADPTAPPTDQSHRKCVGTCRDTFKKCRGRAENKRGGACEADDMRCEKACPKPEPEVAEAPPPAAPAEAGGAPVAAPAAPVAVAPAVKKPRRAARVEGVAAPAPASATPAAVMGEHPGASAPTVRSEAAASSATAPAGASTAVARPAQSERGFFGKLGCFFHSCEPAGSIPCLEGCATAYDDCHARESKRGGECNTRLMHCRQSCRDATPAAR